jgi:hypothetical protein
LKSELSERMICVPLIHQRDNRNPTSTLDKLLYDSH